MFDANYQSWNQNRIKAIIDHFGGHTFFYKKRILDLGTGHGDISGSLARLGGEITAVDARQEHLTTVSKKFPHIKTMKVDLDQEWPFRNQKFDLLLDLAILCHLRDYEKHLTNICAVANDLVIETSVCDNDDPAKCATGIENKNIYDLSINGVYSRPTTAAIERVLTNCGMSFQRITSSKLNAGPYVYDWQPGNDHVAETHKRRLWFVRREAAVMPLQSAPVAYTVNAGFTGSLPSQPVGEGMAKHHHHTIPRPPGDIISTPPTPRLPGMSTNPTIAPNFSSVKVSSRQFAILTPEQLIPAVAFKDIQRTIFPMTPSTCQWFRKISPLFEGLKVNKQALSLQGFPSDTNTHLAMCDIYNLYDGPCTRIWIEEWANVDLTEQHISRLRGKTILTPSLINAQQLIAAQSTLDVVKVPKLWPTYQATPNQQQQSIYLEKRSHLTQSLLSAWKRDWGILLVVGSSLELPDFAQHLSDTEDYATLLNFLTGSKVIIDLNDNHYYKSGILELAKGYNLPMITNNTQYLEYALNTYISQDKAANPYPSNQDIFNGLTKHFTTRATTQLNLNYTNHNDVYHCVKTLVGA